MPPAAASSPDGSNSTSPAVDRILLRVAAATPDPPPSPGCEGCARPVRPSKVRSQPAEAAGQDCAPAPGASALEPRNEPAKAGPGEQRRARGPPPQWPPEEKKNNKKKKTARGEGPAVPAAAYLRRRAGPASLGGRTAGRTRPAASRDPRHRARVATAQADPPPAVGPSTRR